ncbi:MAG: hypothetical protein JO117_05990, partial [Verrucomicrobia bacterium]|nr:hypothetical protein [Verrucomicrobiota bacterium]
MPPLQLPSRGDPRSSSGARLGKGGAGSGGADFSPLGGGGGYAVKRKDNLFLWTVFILLLTGLVMACWVGSYYVYVHPEKPRNYRILTKLKKLLPPQRFSINAAPTGEFITADKLHAKLVAMTPPEFRDNNNDLFRAYLRNYPPGRVTVPYLTGRFNVIESYTLGPTDLATSGVVALAASEDSPKVLIEHLFTAPVNLVPLIKRNLPMGKDLELPRTYYLTAVIHAEKLPDGRMLLTVVPLNYGSYGIKGSPSAFSLEPPNSLDLSGGLPIIKEPQREEAMRAYLAYRQKNGLNPLFGSRRQRPAGSENTSSSAPLTGTDKPPPPPDNESAIERTPPTDTVASATPTPAGRAGNNNRGSRPSTTPAPAPTPSAEPSPSQQRVARALPVNSPGGLAASPSPRQTPSPAPASSPRPTAAVAASASPSPRP